MATLSENIIEPNTTPLAIERPIKYLESTSNATWAPDDFVQPRVFAGLVNRDVTQVYAWAQDGRLPKPVTEATYRQAFTRLIDSLIKQEELKKLKFEENLRLRKEQQERKREGKSEKSTKFTDYIEDGELHPLMADKIRMAIRKDHATTAQTWQKIAIERGEYISAQEMEELVKPFLLTIRDSLDSLSHDFPETQDKVDSIRENLYTLGVQLLTGSKLDRENFVQTILETEIDSLEEAIK